MKKSVMPILVVAALAMLSGCGSTAADFDEAIEDEAIGEVGQAIMPAPVGHWKFDDCTGNIVQNEQGDWGDATLHNGASCGPGYFGTAGIFDGVDDRAEIPYDSVFDFTNALTIQAYVNPNDTTAPQTIVGKWYAPDSYLLWLSNDSYRFSVALAGGGTASVSTPAVAGRFVQVIGTFDGVRLRIYVNGNLGASVEAVGTLQPSARPVTIGNHPTWNPFAGAIDEVKLYDAAWTPVTPAQCMGAGCTGRQCCDP